MIGGADGPTSIFVAGKVGSGESDPLEKDITISVNVFYNLKTVNRWEDVIMYL